MTVMRRQLAAILGAVAVFGAARTRPADADTNFPPVILDYFYEPGCPECAEVRREILPELRSRFEGFYALHELDVSVATNVARLVAYQRALGARDNEPVSIFVDYRHAFLGVKAMRDGLFTRIEKAVADRLAPGWQQPTPIAVPADAAGAMALVDDQARRFTLAAVLAGGLADGINPCAISTLVFFMSLLATAKVRGRGLLAMGLAFCAASFLTYLAIGFGLLQAWRALGAFRYLQGAVNLALTAGLIVLAWLSFRDAWRFARSRRAADVTLQLPDGVKRRIHDVMRTRLRTGNLLAGGFVIGLSVTALESVCTGQVYLPTLVVVARGGGGAARAWGYLLLYNLMFVLPLVLVFLLAFFGTRLTALQEWSRKNVVVSKVLLGLFFAAMAWLVQVL
jgi:hypothetical protein